MITQRTLHGKTKHPTWQHQGCGQLSGNWVYYYLYYYYYYYSYYSQYHCYHFTSTTRDLEVGAPLEVLHHGLLAGAVRLGLHDLLVRDDGVLGVGARGRATKTKESDRLCQPRAFSVAVVPRCQT